MKNDLNVRVIGITRDISDIREDTKRIVDGIFNDYLDNIASIMDTNIANLSVLEKDELLNKIANITNKRIDEELNDDRCFIKEMDKLGARSAGVCYSKDGYDRVLTYDDAHLKRIEDRTKKGGHHSPYDHPNIVMVLSNVPKYLAMILNNIPPYTTSEKSGRYTEMNPSEKEMEEYQKHIEISEGLMAKYNLITNPKVAHKKALELARYVISGCTPTVMVYSVSYRQLNLEYQMLEKLYYSNDTNAIVKMIKPEIKKLMEGFERTGYITDSIKDTKNRTISLFVPDATLNEEYYGDVISANYEISVAGLAQKQRHRTSDVEASMKKDYKFYVPNLYKLDSVTLNEWNKTMEKVGDILPQGMLLDVNECTRYDQFINQLKERRCMCAQGEIFDSVEEVSEKMYLEYLKKNHRNLDDLKRRIGKLRCQYNDYFCPTPCGDIKKFRGPEEYVPEEYKNKAYRLI